MGEGTIYPLMRRMQTDGLVKTYLEELSSGPPRKYYQLTRPATPRSRRRGRMEQSSPRRWPGCCRMQSRGIGREESQEASDDQARIPRYAATPPGAACRQAEIDDLLADYATHFADGMAAGRSEAEIAAALGDPMRLARELRAEAGLRRWETERTPANFFAVLFGFVALIAVDFVFLLPLLGGLVLFTLIAGIVLLALCVAGLVLLRSCSAGITACSLVIPWRAS